MPGFLPLVLGQVVEGMHSTDPPAKGAKNDPMMPIGWINSPSGNKARVFTTTMGASQDLENEGLRRLIVNACYWALGMDDQIPEKSNVDLVGPYHPTAFGFGKYTKGIKPSAHTLSN
jgi:hypothetical protein